MEVLNEDQFMIVFEKGGILTLRWKKETENLTDEIFKIEALKFIDIVRERN